MVRALALDMSGHSGAAFDGPHPGVPMFQTRNLPLVVDDEFGPMFADARRWIADLILVTKPDIICYEAPLVLADRGGRQKVKTNHNVVRQQFGLAAIVECCAFEAGIECAEVNVREVKSYFTGTGHADKRMMMNRCYQLRWNVATDDEADACAIWSMTKSRLDPKFAPQLTPLFRSAAQ